MTFKRVILFALLTLLSSQAVLAQFNNPRGRVNNFLLGLSFGGKVGSTIYFGDLVDAGRVRWTIGGFAEKQFNNFAAVRIGLDAGQCNGLQDIGDGIKFNTTFFNLQALGKLSFLDLLLGYDYDRPFNPYFAIGAGGIFYSCKKHPDKISDDEARQQEIEKYGEDWEYLGWRTSEEGLKVSGSVTGLLGVTYRFTSKLKFFFEAKGDILLTDEFDAHHGYPTGKDTWQESDGKFDALWTLALGVQYRPFDFDTWTTTTSKYNRREKLRLRSSFDRNTKRMRRR